MKEINISVIVQIFCRVWSISSENKLIISARTYVKKIISCKQYENFETICGESLNEVEDVWVSIRVSKFKYIIVGAVYTNYQTQTP